MDARLGISSLYRIQARPLSEVPDVEEGDQPCSLILLNGQEAPLI